MSRYYAMEMEVQKPNITEDEVERLCDVFQEKWAPDDDPMVFMNATVVCNGESKLSGGETEGEAHQRIAEAVFKAVPGCQEVTTRWTYLEELPFEEYITTADEMGG